MFGHKDIKERLLLTGGGCLLAMVGRQMEHEFPSRYLRSNMLLMIRDGES